MMKRGGTIAGVLILLSVPMMARAKDGGVAPVGTSDPAAARAGAGLPTLPTLRTASASTAPPPSGPRVPAAVQEPAREEETISRSHLGAAFVGAGGLAAAVGGLFIGLDGHDHGADSVWATKAPGAALLGAGIAAAVFGGVLMVTDPGSGLFLGMGPGSLRLAGRF